MKRKILLFILSACLIAAIFAVPAFGDVGNNEFGFDDWGGGDDWDGDGGSLVDIAWLIAIFSDNPILAVIVVAVLVAVVIIGKRKNHAGGTRPGGERVQVSSVS
ncbi:MAG: hypothetical protein J5940_05500, partial [Clostridia bacterium]|nr:hypothetical protein [Clostridia bacterium]